MKEIKKQALSDKHYFWYSKRQSCSDLLNQILQKGFNTHDPSPATDTGHGHS